MYWEGDIPWLAAGVGAASYDQTRGRFSRPKQLKKYFDYVQTLGSQSKDSDSSADS